ncbi:MAG TPA: hypothetical protein VIU35_09455 [Chitinophagaceae bacterium]
MSKLSYIRFTLGLFFFILSPSCKNEEKDQCDYVAISKTLLRNIKSNNEANIKNMMAFKDELFWKEGSGWTTIFEASKESLDSVSDLNEFKYTIDLNKKKLTDYATVTFLIRQREQIKDFIIVNFSHPKSPLGCKIQSFDFLRTGASNKINIHPNVNEH